MIKFLIALALVIGFVWAGSTIKLGKRTFFGHVRAIWHTEEAQDLRNGVRDTAGPAVHKVERGIEAGYKAMKDGSGSGSGSGATAGSGEGSGTARVVPDAGARP